MEERTCRLGILSDIHYAAAAERSLGDRYELRAISNPLLRLLVHGYRHFFWMRRPLEQGRMLEPFLAQAGPFDLVVANGDYSCDSGFVGVSDEAARQSTRECLDRLRSRFGPSRVRINFGDHELGKTSFFGGCGGMRLESWRRSVEDLGFEPFWQVTLGNYVLMGVTSSLVALPVFEPETLPEERPEWRRLRSVHMDAIRQAFNSLKPDQRVLLFCHDPTALPFLWREDCIRSRVSQIEQTVIGHLHSSLILWKSRWLSGMPVIRFLGNTARRLSTALNQARCWKAFHLRLCPSLAGIQLLRDGGYLSVELDLEARRPARFQFHRLRWPDR